MPFKERRRTFSDSLMDPLNARQALRCWHSGSLPRTDRDRDRCQTVWIAHLSRMEAPVDTDTLTSGFCLSSCDATVDTRNGGESAGNALEEIEKVIYD